MKKCSLKCIELNEECPNFSCVYWINYPDDLNCDLIAINKNGRYGIKRNSK